MKKFAGLIDQFSDFEKSKIVIAQAPYAGTVSYGKGAELGPEAIIEASKHLELFDLELEKNFAGELGIHSLKPYKLPEKPKYAVESMYKETKKLLEKDKFVITLGGEHTVSVGAVKAYSEKFDDLSVLYLDAHADLRNEFEGQKYSHACTLRRISEFNKSFVHVGCRSLCEEGYGKIKEKNYNFIWMQEIKEKGSQIGKILSGLQENVYVSIDIDVLDPAVMPSTGTPESGGMNWYEITEILKEVGKKKNIVGFDLVELAPKEGLKAPDFTAAKLVYKLLGYSLVQK
ncbi:MAG: agmatinase [Candidatus Undinarchaeales archaeon]